MDQRLVQVAVVVKDYDEAIAFYTQKLGFILVKDTQLSDTKRWVTIRPSNESSCTLLLAKAANDRQWAAIGNQTGGRVFLFLHTDDCWRDYHDMTGKQVKFTAPPREEPYGTVAVFEDLYGNLWDLIQPKP
jgi:catechol 2,3-dioxygenase-like lactoylglutathione lyase family enzyme